MCRLQRFPQLYWAVLRTGIVSFTFVLLIFHYFLFLGRLLVLYFSLVAPAICYMFFIHVVCSMCSWQINDDDDDGDGPIGAESVGWRDDHYTVNDQNVAIYWLVLTSLCVSTPLISVCGTAFCPLFNKMNMMTNPWRQRPIDCFPPSPLFSTSQERCYFSSRFTRNYLWSGREGLPAFLKVSVYGSPTGALERTPGVWFWNFNCFNKCVFSQVREQWGLWMRPV